MGDIKEKMIYLFDVMILLLNEIIEGKKISNEYEKGRLKIWKSDMRNKMIFDEPWPDGFWEDWE
tara:strand:+ start:330 stop:521 length:192 start_codon:yes stop_codon:yes gene_type:complete